MNTTSLRVYQDAVAIITGGASGIGLGFARTLASQGCMVVLADLQHEVAQKEAETICNQGGRATAALLDVRDADAFKKLIDETLQSHGRIDYLFNNAGINAGWDVKDDPLDDWNYIIDVNIRGVVHGIHAVYPIMIEQGFGHIINTASSAGLVPASFAVSYSMTKHAVVGLSTSLRSQATEYDIRVSVLCPGFVDTPILKGGVYGRTNAAVMEKVHKAFTPPPAISTEEFVGKALRKIEKNHSIIVEPRDMRVMWLLYRLFPDMIMNGFTKAWLKIKAKLHALSTT